RFGIITSMIARNSTSAAASSTTCTQVGTSSTRRWPGESAMGLTGCQRAIAPRTNPSAASKIVPVRSDPDIARSTPHRQQFAGAQGPLHPRGMYGARGRVEVTGRRPRLEINPISVPAEGVAMLALERLQATTILADFVRRQAVDREQAAVTLVV